MIKNRLILFAFSFLILGCSTAAVVNLPDGSAVRIEVVRTMEEKQSGLMNRTELGDRSGMLFVYEEEQNMAFWMKNTLIPLDIIFLNSNQQIVDIKSMQPCENDPCASYPSVAPAQYALEVNEGKANEWGLDIGDKLDLFLP